jgi:peptidoglycan/xylan/chitin deacetylase (PgdA/CDA1 family)
MRPFLVSVHDATPAYARETRLIIEGLTPLVGSRFSFGVVPDWYGDWPLAAHLGYCRMVDGAADEILLHGYHHRRQRGQGPTSWLTGGTDEMNGLDAEETRATLQRGQQVFREVFGRPARGFLPPAWQKGHVRPAAPGAVIQNRWEPDHVLGFFSLDSADSTLPLATWTWDVSRWGWLGHVGHGVGSVLQKAGAGVPSLAIHPRDLLRGFWPKILRLIQDLLHEGYEPTTCAGLLEAKGAEARL